ncbi:hypothetical protein [Candidatus Poriferisodalis sp.]|uniref:hypothetical protein n=1 Tax=Candidatus Poriferisodalis sp. TaxID=3101277 RepID=UPI003B595EBC
MRIERQFYLIVLSALLIVSTFACGGVSFDSAACNAHNAPVPAKKLDWVMERKNQLPDVSCEVGVGIRAGTWQWSEDSSLACVFVVIGGNAKREWSLGQFQDRRDARNPIPLNDGEFVWGVSEEGGSMDPYSTGSSHPICVLEWIDE